MASEKSETLNIKYFCTDEYSRQQGLMKKPKLKLLECAFFIFPIEQNLSFWNKNVDFDIYLIFADSNNNILCHKKLLAHQESPVYSCGQAKYVIEISTENSEKILHSNRFSLEGNQIILFKDTKESCVFENRNFQKLANSFYKSIK